MKQQKKRSSETIDIVSYALKISVNGVTCVFVVLFRTKKIHLKFVKRVTGDNLILHKALAIATITEGGTFLHFHSVQWHSG